MTQIPILTYHANNINGMEYQNNDHVALAADLQLIHELGFEIITLDRLMAWRSGKMPDSAIQNAVVLTCDDGTWFDFHDLDHPTYGHQTSFYNILNKYQKQHQVQVHMSNFVIVSPEARKILDEKCLIGKSWWQDDWWLTAQQSGLMSIENHSWDHNHGVLDNDNINDDSFRCINNKKSCDQQIKQAQEFLHQMMEGTYQAQYFAYPYGNFSDYLRYEYLPVFGPRMNLSAAFTTEAAHVTKFSKIWAIPRYVCNNDWRDVESLKRILLSKK
ncbi:MAG: polysaccharide deacetylase family protein [Marinicella sp.]